MSRSFLESILGRDDREPEALFAESVFCKVIAVDQLIYPGRVLRSHESSAVRRIGYHELPWQGSELFEIFRRHLGSIAYPELCKSADSGCFRVALGGAQEAYGIFPDITCLGKIIGGGLPVAAYGGRRDIMQQVSPAGPVYQAGTLSGNPLAMTAGIETLQILSQEGYAAQIERQTTKLLDGWKVQAEKAGIKIQAHQAGSMMGIFFSEQEVWNYEDAAAADQEAFKRWFLSMLEQGIYLAPSQFETIFLSGAHTDADIDRTIEAAGKAFRQVAKQ